MYDDPISLCKLLKTDVRSRYEFNVLPVVVHITKVPFIQLVKTSIVFYINMLQMVLSVRLSFNRLEKSKEKPQNWNRKVGQIFYDFIFTQFFFFVHKTIIQKAYNTSSCLWNNKEDNKNLIFSIRKRHCISKVATSIT